MDNQLKERAISSTGVSNRAAGNQVFGKHDFREWCRDIINGLNFSSVLDL